MRGRRVGVLGNRGAAEGHALLVEAVERASCALRIQPAPRDAASHDVGHAPARRPGPVGSGRDEGGGRGTPLGLGTRGRGAVVVVWREATQREHRYAATELLAWPREPDRWLRRAAIIAQFGLCSRTDPDLLVRVVDANAAERDFFVRKAIGWPFRDHARTEPDCVRAFVAARGAELRSMSRREAAEHLV